jgi:hypothetical protein
VQTTKLIIKVLEAINFQDDRMRPNLLSSIIDAVVNPDNWFQIGLFRFKIQFYKQNNLGPRLDIGRPRSVTAPCCNNRKSDSIE